MSADVSLYFIRHAETVWNAENQHLVGGRSNHTPLTEVGQQQAVRLGHYLAQHVERPDVVYVSPAVRTLETARISLRAAGIQRHIRVEPRLQEVSQGPAEGMPKADIWTPDTILEAQTQGLDFKNPGGQSMREVGSIVLGWLDEQYEEILKDFGNAYVFGHGLSIRCLVGAIQGWDFGQVYQSITDNTSITNIVGQPGDWQVNYFALNPQHQDAVG